MDDLALGARIKRARERARMTQLELAEQLDVTRRTVANWETGQTSPLNRLGAIEEVLGRWGFTSLHEAPPPVQERPEEPAGAVAVVEQILDVLHSRFSDSTKIAMIAEVIERDYPGVADEAPVVEGRAVR
ncbi:helix-turn-helix transcriptional regulator [Micromonospora aurantiaca]|uniref:helix-turn-helix transcriptional regulator n=1 Tax=Micromonospora aurantiaca (nom. illeg.) TaxID=47850 RepID=UPI00343092FA